MIRFANKSTRFLSILIMIVFTLFSCKQKEHSQIEVIKFDKKIIDTLKQRSDTSYSAFIGSNNFYTEDTYVNNKDSLITKVLKDSSGNVVGMNKSKNGTMLLAAEYYPNGQLIGKMQIKDGKVNGSAVYYYPDGRIKSQGNWLAFKKVGTWKSFGEDGLPYEVDNYDSNGHLIKSKKIDN